MDVVVVKEIAFGGWRVDSVAYPNASSKDDQNLMGSPFGSLGAAEGPTGLHQGQLSLRQFAYQAL